MSTVKNYTFQLRRQNDRVGSHHTLRLQATARTLAEAEADFRHWLRVNFPEVLDEAKAWGYTVEVRHV